VTEPSLPVTDVLQVNCLKTPARCFRSPAAGTSSTGSDATTPGFAVFPPPAVTSNQEVTFGPHHHIGFVMTLVKSVATVVPTVLLSAVAVLGMAVLIGLSAWELPIRFDD
jgi:hypothetical protein